MHQQIVKSQRNLRTLDLNLLPIFDALMQQQHLSRAAEQLSMSQPAVSNALKRLRERFNDPLFIRTAQGLRPTSRAIQLQQQFQPALNQIQQAWQPEIFEPKTSQQNFYLATNAATEYLLAPYLISWLRQTAPHISVHLLPEQTTDIAGKLKQGQLDFVIDFIAYQPSQFQKQLLAYEKLTVICSKQHPLLKGEISIEQFQQLPQVSLIPRQSNHQHQQLGLTVEQQGTPFQQLMGQQLPSRNLKAHVSSFVAIPEIVSNTDLIAVVPLKIALHYQAKLQLIEMPFDYPEVPIYLQWHNNRQKDAAHVWLRESIKALSKEIDNNI
ncbi:LysR substrate-binding domain-containing protein [Pelagibaculum spongiae]|uniref:HTH lysR-type domain-containing protein n=1 Tax=Pelagibaculum spongiae TaxID=2080658 RepID=A0A2V1GXX4_9GAMM|nr:LysR substrate-binding domain-containing protein [Pelagibaculum spongiae]PVZ66796.1 hypothetical protein DC094_16185 [Pelagibaculum spongiae]